MSRSSLLTTFVLSHKCAQFESKLSVTEPFPVVINQGKTALKPGFDKLIRWLIASRLFL
jgi:hypothetical protein